MAVVTEVRFRRANGEGRVKALATVVLDGDWAVHGVQVVEGPHGLFVACPARRNGAGEYRDIAHPISAAAREQLTTAVLMAYHEWACE